MSLPRYTDLAQAEITDRGDNAGVSHELINPGLHQIGFLDLSDWKSVAHALVQLRKAVAISDLERPSMG
ncbi:MAG: hypothetical protein ACR2QW_00600 [bacterium]